MKKLIMRKSTSAQERKGQDNAAEQQSSRAVARGSWFVARFQHLPVTSHQSPSTICYSLLPIVYCLFLTISYSLLPIACLYGAFEEKIPSARNAGLSGAAVALSNDSDLIFYNPASLGQLPGASFSFSHTSLFNISDLSYMVFTGAVPTRALGSFGFAYSQFGPAIYKETEVVLSHSFSLGRKFLFGYNIKNQSVNIKNFGSASGMGIDVGVYSIVLNNVAAGFSVKNLNNPTLGATAETLPQNYRIGITYFPELGIVFLLDMSKDILADELSYHAGGEINITKNFIFRAGTRTNPAGFSAGFGVVFNAFRLNYAMLTHPVLDAQHFFTLGVRFGQEEVDVSPGRRPGRRTRRRTADTRAREDTDEALKSLIVNINTATLEELDQIPGVGALTAQRIIDYRQERGRFGTIEDLMNVQRITKKTFEKIRPYITVEDVKKAPKEIAPPEEVAPKLVPKVPVQKTEEFPDEPEEESSAPVLPPAKEKKKPQPIKVEPEVVPVLDAPVIPVVPPAPAPTPSAAPVGEKEIEPSLISDDRLDVNLATEQELEVAGFTSTQAKNIIRYRKKSGNFTSVDNLLKVPGVDARTVERVRELIKANSK